MICHLLECVVLGNSYQIAQTFSLQTKRNTSLIYDVIHREKANLLDLCDRLLDINPAMRPTTQMVLLFRFHFQYVDFQPSFPERHPSNRTIYPNRPDEKA